MSPLPSLNVAELFCGAGGLSQGLHEAGFSVVAASDHDPDACATYRLNFPDTELIEGDLTDEAVRERVIASIAANGGLDVLAGGPPCQGFSQMRNHDRIIDDPRNRLYREFVHLLAELRPRALLLENVPGLNQMAGGAVRRQIEEDLSVGGEYKVVSGVLDAGDFGTPQTRERLVFLGVRVGLGDARLPIGTGVAAALRLHRRGRGHLYDVDGRDELLAVLRDPQDLRAVTASQALSDLVQPGDAYTRPPQSAFQAVMRSGSARPQEHMPSRIREETVRRLAAIPPVGNVYDLPDELLVRDLDGKRWGPAGNGATLARRHFYAYRRLHPDWLAWTANTKADFAYHYAVPRGLSAREAARIQGFPDAFHFNVAPKGTPGKLYGGNRHSVYRQIGNAVPPPLGAALGGSLALALADASAELTAAA